MNERPKEIGACEFRFGPFRLLNGERTLWNGDRPVRIGSRALDVLIALVTRAGELVSKRELVAIVWPDTIVVEANLTVHVTALRRALGDGQDGNRYIVNIPGRGYRFVAPVTISRREMPSGGAGQRPTVRHNLPVQVVRLIGRESIVGNLARKVAAQRSLTVVGPGGVGKTAVALEVAERCIGAFEDGVWLVDLAPVTDPKLVPTALAAALGLEVRSEEPLPGLVGALSEKRLLLVLDNCEHVIEEAAILVVSLLRGARWIHVLSTSREPLRHDGEQVYRLAPLDVPEDYASLTSSEAMGFPAIQLFADRAAAMAGEFTLTDADAPSAAEICRKLDGMPLAIEFAAARVDAFGVRGLASRLDDSLGLLGHGSRGARPRQHTIRDTLDWSYRLLSPREQTVFRRLAVFVGGFTLEAAQAVVCGPGDGLADIGGDIANLVVKSLVAADVSEGDARFHLLMTTRSYGLEKIAGQGESDLLALRLATYFAGHLEAAEQATAGKRATLAGIAIPDIDNIRAALTFAFGPDGDRHIAIALAAASAPIWLEMSLLTECQTWTSRAISVLGDEDRDTRREMVLRTEFGMSLMHTAGDSNPARAALLRASELAERLGDVGYHLRAISGLTNLCLRLEQFREALALAQRAEAVVRGSSNPVALSTADFLFSGALVYLGDYARAMAYAQKAFARVKPIATRAPVLRSGLDHTIQARCVVGNIQWLSGQLDQAMSTTRQVMADAEAGGHAVSMCFALAWCGCPISMRLGDLDEAERAISALRDWSDRHQLPSYQACTLGFEGALLAKRGDYCDAEDKLRAGLRGLSEAQFEVQYTSFLSILAVTLARIGRSDEGLLLADEAIARSERNSVLWWLPEALRIKGEIAMEMEGGDIDLAGDCFRRSLELSAGQGALFWELRAALNLSRMEERRGRIDIARELLGSVYAKFREGFATADMKQARCLLEKWTSG